MSQSTMEFPDTCHVVRALLWQSSKLNPPLVEAYMYWFCILFAIRNVCAEYDSMNKQAASEVTIPLSFHKSHVYTVVHKGDSVELRFVWFLKP